MNLQDWLFIVTAAAAVGQVGTLFAMMLQLRDFRKQTQASAKATRDATRATVWLEMLAIDRFFGEHPELREQFYGTSKLHKDQRTAQAYEAAAEMLLDFAECMMTQKDHLNGGFAGWREYYQKLFKESAVLRKFWSQNHQWFQEDLRHAIDSLIPTPKPTHRSHKRSRSKTTAKA